MKEFKYIITDAEGIHARPAGLLVKLASGFSSVLTMEKDGKTADIKRIFGIMGLGVKQGQEVKITALGPDEALAIEEIEKFFRKNL